MPLFTLNIFRTSGIFSECISKSLLRALLIAFSLFCLNLVQAQQICQPGQPMAQTCATACVVCDLDGYSSMTVNSIQGQAPPGYCTQIVHTMHWVGFVAGSANLTFDVQVDPCFTGSGIEMGIYQTDDCQNFSLVSNCNTAMIQNNTYPFQNITPLTPGCVYYLVWDNNGPASCPFTITVTSGSAAAPVPSPPAVPQGPTQVCPGATVTYSIPEVFGACDYTWTAPSDALINGQPGPLTLTGAGANTVDVTFGNQSGNVCVNAVNPCHANTPSCLPVQVAPIPPTILPPVSICNGDSYQFVNGNFFNSSTQMSATFPSWLGCDSTVTQLLEVRPPIITNLGTQTICEGECITVGGQEFCTPGFYQVVLNSYQDCDSTVFFSLLPFPIVADIAPADTLDCLNNNIVLDGTGSTASSDYFWFNPEDSLIGNAITQPVDMAGDYVLVVERFVGGLVCVDTAFMTVEIDSLGPSVVAVGDSMDCDGNAVILDGMAVGDSLLFVWTGPGIDSTNQDQEDPSVNQPGQYFLSVTNLENGCDGVDSADVYFPGPPPDLQLAADTLNCFGAANITAMSSDSTASFGWTGPNGFISSAADTLAEVPGWYFATVTSTTGCEMLDSIEVIADEAIPDISISGDSLNCSITQVVLNSASANNNLVYDWSGPGGITGSEDSLIVVDAGIYDLLVTAMNGCTNSAQFEVSIDTLTPDVQANGGVLDCFGNPVMLLGQSVTQGVQYDWSGPGGFTSTIQNPDATQSGDYVLIVTAPNGCTNSATAQVTLDAGIPDLAAAPVGPGTLDCTNPSIDINAQSNTPGVTLGWTGPGGFDSPNATINISVPGDYTVVAMAPNGCTSSQTVPVPIDTLSPDLVLSGDTLSCATPDGFIAAASVTQGVSYSWMGPGGFIGSDSLEQINVPGQYPVIITAPNGCTSSGSAEVVGDFDEPDLSASVSGVLTCANTTVSLQANSADQNVIFQWMDENGNPTDSSYLETILPGFFEIAATGSNGCISLDTLEVLQDITAPQGNILVETISCANPTVPLSAESNDTNLQYSWMGPAGFTGTDSSVTITNPGTYDLILTGTNGCTTELQASVPADTVAPVVGASVSNMLTCSDTLSVLDGASSDPLSTYSWMGPSSYMSVQEDPSVNAPGQYDLLVTASNGCTSTSSVLVDQDIATPDIQVAGDTLSCLTPGVTISGSSLTPGVLFDWTGPNNFSSTQSDPFVSVSGDYTLVLTAPNGCTSSAAATVIPDAGEPDLAVSTSDTITCADPTGVLLAQSMTPGVLYQWTGPNGFNDTNAQVTVSNSGVYSVVITAPNGCTTAESIMLEENTVPPGVMASGGVLTCVDTTLALSGSSPAMNPQYLWTGPNGFNSSLQNPTTSAPGIYTLLVTGTNGCTSETTTMVDSDIVPPVFNIPSSIPNLTCADTLQGITANSADPDLSYQWSGPGGFTANTAQINVQSPGAYTVIATSLNGCTAAASVEVAQDIAQPDIVATADTVDCAQTQGTLSSNSMTAGLSYAWTGPGGFNQQSQNITVSEPGIYQLLVTAPNGCTNTTSAVLSADTIAPVVVANGGEVSCADPIVTLNAQATPSDGTYSWTGPGGIVLTGAMAETQLPGNYNLVVTGTNGCTSEAGAVVTADTVAPVVDLMADVLTCRDSNAFVTAFVDPSDATISWIGPQSGLPSQEQIEVQTAGIYELTATGSNGCTQTAQIEVEQVLPDWTVFLGPDTTVLQGTRITVFAESELPESELAVRYWLPEFGCFNCSYQDFEVNREISLQVVMEDVNGCRMTDQMLISIIPNGIYVPNIFSPNNDGQDDLFRIFDGGGVDYIESFSIFDRWGEQVFFAENVLPADPQAAWDGTLNGSELQPAVYIWQAVAIMVDGTEVYLKGDVTLVR